MLSSFLLALESAKAMVLPGRALALAGLALLQSTVKGTFRPLNPSCLLLCSASPFLHPATGSNARPKTTYP